MRTWWRRSKGVNGVGGVREWLKTHDICARLLKSTAGTCRSARGQPSNEYASLVAITGPCIIPELGREDGRRRIRRRQSDIDMRSSPRLGGCATSIGMNVRTAFPVPKRSHARARAFSFRTGRAVCLQFHRDGLDVELPRDGGTQRVSESVVRQEIEQRMAGDT